MDGRGEGGAIGGGMVEIFRLMQAQQEQQRWMLAQQEEERWQREEYQHQLEEQR